MRVLGIDPGYAILGYGVVDYEAGRLRLVDHGTVETAPGQPFEHRLLAIADAVGEIISRTKPELVAIEEQFFAQNKTTALGTAQARGAVITEAARAGLRVYEYTPAEIKKAVTGAGRAEKGQVQLMVKVLLNLTEVPRPDDAADALAVAICQAFTGRLESFELYGGYQGRAARARGSGRG
ncbi:MAG: crossover junction endodeoxyribonuclease RuvC [Bacillota bacterium]|nr:crossover junction endodeoxyribonuclease RuvC [Bacillota bacterium]